MIEPSDISEDLGLGRLVLGYARPIAPCLQSLEVEDRLTAIEVLRRVAKRIPAPEEWAVKGRAVGDWSETRFSDRELDGFFGVNDTTALRAMCGEAPVVSGPVYSFPEPDRATKNLWS